MEEGGEASEAAELTRQRRHGWPSITAAPRVASDSRFPPAIEESTRRIEEGVSKEVSDSEESGSDTNLRGADGIREAPGRVARRRGGILPHFPTGG